MNLSSNFMWLGIFLFVVIGVSIYKKPTRTQPKKGPFDRPVHTKPLFKISSFIIMLLVLFLLVSRT